MPLPRSRARKTAKKAAKRGFSGKVAPKSKKTLRKGEGETLRKKGTKSTKITQVLKKPVSKSHGLKVSKSSAPAPVWTPDQVLADGQHEKFAQKVAMCCYSNTSCYLQAYAPEDEKEIAQARKHAHRLMTKEDISARVTWLKEQGAKNVVAEIGEMKLTLLNIVRTPSGYVDPESPLCEGIDRNGNAVMPSKLGAIKLLGEWEGWKQKEEIDLNVNYTRPEEALQKAMGAGVNVKALLSKLLGGGGK